MAKIEAICISEARGTRKHPVESAWLVPDWGIQGDAHAGHWHRQVSLLAVESVDKMRGKGIELAPGDFAENLLVSGLALKQLPVGTVLAAGEARLRVTQIGKECHNDCEIRRLVGSCVMPTDGIFAEVIRGGEIRPGDEIHLEVKEG